MQRKRLLYSPKFVSPRTLRHRFNIGKRRVNEPEQFYEKLAVGLVDAGGPRCRLIDVRYPEYLKEGTENQSGESRIEAKCLVSCQVITAEAVVR